MLAKTKRHWLLLFYIVFACWLPMYSQNCLETGMTFTTQKMIDDFRGLYPNCLNITGDVVIEEGRDESIQNLEGFSGIKSISGALQIKNNANLTHLNGLNGLERIGGSLSITSNLRLKDLSGLTKLRHIGNSVSIGTNNNLLNLVGLDSIRFIDGDLTITDNHSLVSLSGLDQLTSISEHLIISNNQALIHLAGLSGITLIGKDLHINENEHLITVEGLENLREIGGDVIIDQNNRLITLKGLKALSKTFGNIHITNNEALINLDGLIALKAIEGFIQIFNNPLIKSLAGLDSIDAKSITELIVLSSSALSSCAVKSVCDYLQQPGSLSSIWENDLGCNSIAEILESCSHSGLNSTPLKRSDNNFYPNPTTGELFIRDPVPDGAQFQAIDIAGQLLKTGLVNQNRFDLSGLAAGMYLIEVWWEDEHLKEFVIVIQ